VVQRRRVGDEVPRYQYGLGYPKGNNGLGQGSRPTPVRWSTRVSADLVKPGYSGNAIARCLTGTGPASWSLNGKEDPGSTISNGNVWEWTDHPDRDRRRITRSTPRYPGAGASCCRPSNGYITIALCPEQRTEEPIACGRRRSPPATVGSCKPRVRQRLLLPGNRSACGVPGRLLGQ
jgi:hypothetical protein